MPAARSTQLPTTAAKLHRPAAMLPLSTLPEAAPRCTVKRKLAPRKWRQAAAWSAKRIGGPGLGGVPCDGDVGGHDTVHNALRLIRWESVLPLGRRWQSSLPGPALVAPREDT
eukprot:TRINITY_DN16372_c0_g1_i1.p6 TRINITY_DN16372_c0_g1~~TRINITY_DN16372_c0_g1_i1.p6  ORF type:complete len:113 (-),score=3.43 TRINITY_DN16372_c0_g1_i1:47-385(-)